jgi:hypothetical protein
MKNSVVYMVAAYAGTAAFYGAYLAWLLAQERRLGRRGHDAPR